MENLLCHTGRIFTLDEVDGQAKTAPESMPSGMTESLEDVKEVDMPDWPPAEQRATKVDAFRLWLDAWTFRRHTVG